MSKAVFLGRFQPLHRGHHQVIEKNREEHDELQIAVGSADREREEENPLSFEERKEVIQSCFDLEVIAVEDTEKTEDGNRRWAEKLEQQLDVDVIISNNDLVEELVERHTGFKVKRQQMYEPEIYSGTEVRRRIRSGEEWRYLVPDCALAKVEELADVIEETGIDYDFKPGWKKENIDN